MRRLKLTQLTILGILAGILYNSWPLGYWLNRRVADVSLASGFEALHQPYNWVFIGTDVASSILVVVMCALLWNLYSNDRSIVMRISLTCAGLFAIGTSVDALLPEHCVPNLMQCASFTQDHFLLLHGLFSILASVFLFIALLILWARIPRDLLLDLVLFGYVVFGLISLIEAVGPGKGGNWSQYYYITLCSVWIALIPYAISRLVANQESLLEQLGKLVAKNK